MLDPPNKRNMFKFCRAPTTDCTSSEAVRTIFDYSTSEAYNLDYAMGADEGSLTRQNASYDLNAYPQQQVNDRYYRQNTYSSGYNTYESPYGYQMASTSSQQHEPGTLTYQTSTNESAFVKACCGNNYLLANTNEQINYHSTYEHRQIYEAMASRAYPPLHYAYRPVPTEPPQLPLPSLHANLYDHHGYLQNPPNYKPMERYNYLRPTPEEVAALHNEDEENDSESDTDVMDFSDEESDDIDESNKKSQQVNSTSENQTFEENPNEAKCNDSIQIFEITSSSFHDLDKTEKLKDSNENVEFKTKPTKSNNKENTERSLRKKKVSTPATVVGRFYATRQTDRKMRSGNVQSGVQKSIGKEKLQRRITRSIRKVVKNLSDHKKLELIANVSRGGMRKIVANKVDKEATKISQKPRILRSAPIREVDGPVKKQSIDRCSVIVRSLRSNSSSSNVMKTKIEKPATRKRTSTFFESIERSVRDRRLK